MNPVRLSAPLPVAAFLLALPLVLSACGNKGPLTLPPKNVPQVVMPSDMPPSQDGQQVGDPSDSLDQVPKADDGEAGSDLDGGDADPPENADTNAETNSDTP
ncbi:LPS translocon maturation chaperone LptM [Lysobacter arvi]|uniref:Lipoprotein n=1 Tax=Lysobacter arvi TaxID=3038776 RepID=A0ABU1CGU0_9GAMM|nr:lipoprotein [Lysobacter arvi]MDR0184152.1 lipoprotein [Lysobacter arvi]